MISVESTNLHLKKKSYELLLIPNWALVPSKQWKLVRDQLGVSGKAFLGLC